MKGCKTKVGQQLTVIEIISTAFKRSLEKHRWREPIGHAQKSYVGKNMNLKDDYVIFVSVRYC